MTGLLHHGVSAQAQRRPEATAIVFRDQRLSYGEMDAASDRLARVLRAHGVARGDRVFLLLPKTPAALIAILATLKADAIYVPLDSAGPAARLARMIAVAEGRWILAGGPVGGLLAELFAEPAFARDHAVGWLAPDTPPVAVGFDQAAVDVAPAGPLPNAAHPTDPAHLLFTSGSTGVPKGVMVTHASVGHFVRWAVEYFGTAPGERISAHPPLHFDLSTFDIFATFTAGATLYPVPAEVSLVPGVLAEFIRANQLTQWFSVPSVLNYLAKFDAVRPGDFPALRRVLWCGEVLPTPSLIYWMERVPHARYTNLYGPTETAIASSYYTVPRRPDDPGAAIPIGTACPGEALVVLDEHLAPVPAGQAGQIGIRGVGLSPGYWRDDDKTRAAFVSVPAGGDPADRTYLTGDLGRVGPDGLLYYLGRADSQIKSRGYRIELGEIESALAQLEGVRECAVVAIERGGFEGKMICAAYVAAAGAGRDPAGLRRRLGHAVPGYMLPARWRAYDALPKNPNGKIDRPRLRADFEREVAAGEA
jgi:amino acid adenylation domain-containing protein